MSERINLAELCRGRSQHDRSSGTYAIPVEVFDALIDAVEAAHAFEPQPDKWSNGDQRDALRKALARFDFAKPEPGYITEGGPN